VWRELEPEYSGSIGKWAPSEMKFPPNAQITIRRTEEPSHQKALESILKGRLKPGDLKTDSLFFFFSRTVGKAAYALREVVTSPYPEILPYFVAFL